MPPVKDRRGKGLHRLIPAGLCIVLILLGLAIPLTLSAGAGATSLTGSISGEVFTNDGVTPIEGAVIFVNDFQTGTTAGSATSDANGAYVVSDLPTGDYRLLANATVQGFPIQHYNGAEAADDATPVSVSEGTETSTINFTLGVGATISGTVYEADGITPVDNADVWADSYECCAGGEGTRTAPDGTFTITGLAPGDYRVGARASDQGLAGEFYDDTTDRDLAARVSVSAGQTTPDIDSPLELGGSISGTVYEADGVTPVGDADVWADSYDCCDGGEGTRTAPDGTFTITGLAPGDYRVAARTEGYTREFYDDTTDWNLAARISVTAGVTTPDTDFSLEPGGSISGTVYEADGVTPVGNADVWADSYECCGGGEGTRTAPDGTFTITGLAPGDYRVAARTEGYTREFYDDTTDWNLAARISVTAGVTTPDIDFSLEQGGSISGTVYEADGVTPVGNADVWADSYDCCVGGEGTRTAPDGTFTITGLAPGDYRVGARGSDQGLAGSA